MENFNRILKLVSIADITLLDYVQTFLLMAILVSMILIAVFDQPPDPQGYDPNPIAIFFSY